MESLPKDVLVLLAFDLDYADILKLCSSTKRINRAICDNEYFWRNKLYKTYPFARKLQEKYPITNFRKFYQDVERNKALRGNGEERVGSFDMPSFIKPELRNFFTYADFGVISGTEVPLNYILWPILQKELCQDLLVISS